MGVQIKINGKTKTDINELFKGVSDYSEKLNRRIINALELACRAVVTKARELPSPPETMRGTPHQPHYIDDTEVLRNSIGFVIYDKGVKVHQNFTQKQGSEQGLAVADEAAAKFPNQLVAIIVAGANYAAAVESKGYFVLTQPTMELPTILQQYLQEVAKRV